MYFLSDLSKTHADFAKQKKQEEKPSTLREKIIGRTNAGKAFRVGAVASALGLGGLALKNKTKLTAIAKNPRRYFTSKVNGKDTTVISRKKEIIKNPEYNPEKPYKVKNREEGTVKYLTQEQADKIRKEGNDYDRQIEDVDEYKEVYSQDYNPVRKTEKDKRSFLGTGRKVRWNRVGKTGAIGLGALAIPTGAAYVAGNEKDKKDIENRVGKTWGNASKAANDARTWVNTLHRVSR